MNKIIYVGNRLQGAGLNPTTVDTLGDKLENNFQLIRASKQQSTVLRILDIWWTIIRNRKGADFLIIDTYSTTAFLYAWTSGILAKLIGLAYIPYLHGGDLPKRYVRSNKTSKRYLANASRIISPSNFLKSETEKFFNVSVQVIPNYLELDKYPYLIKSIDTDLNLLWVRAFHEIYNPVLAVKVLKKIRSIGVNCNLTMVGPDKDGSMEVVKRFAKKNGLEDSIKFTGRLKKKDWIKESKDSHIFINTTNADNTPVSVMEAMCLGLPIVSTNVGGLPYIINNSVDGFLVNPNDFEAMADAIMLLRDNPKVYSDISKNARQKAESWDWLEVEKKWNTLLSNE